MPNVVVVGAQWGDEGKGKVVHALSSTADLVVRAQGGNNAGHTIVIGSEEYKLHLIPSGILEPRPRCYIAGGSVIDLAALVLEMEALSARGIQLEGRLGVSPYAHVIFPYHRTMDLLSEKRKGAALIGTTGKGIGPCYADKAMRIGIRLADMADRRHFRETLHTVLEQKNEEMTKLYHVEPLSFEEVFEEYSGYFERISPFLMPVEALITAACEDKKHVLFEGAQGALLDNTFGSYPYVTSSSTLASGVLAGAGMGPCHDIKVLGVAKAYTTRVGEGPFPTEVEENHVFLDHSAAREFGVTTGRKRRIGWFDAVVVKTAKRLNAFRSFAFTKLDVLDELEEILVCKGYVIQGKEVDRLPASLQEFSLAKPVYETFKGWKSPTQGITAFAKLPKEARTLIHRIEELIGAAAGIVSVGPRKDQTIMREDILAKEGLF